MSNSELIPELENIVSEYTDIEDYKKLMIYNPELYTECKLRNKLILNIPTNTLIVYSEMYNLAVLYNSEMSQQVYLSPEFLTGIFMKYYSNIKNLGLNVHSIISNPDIRDEIETNIEIIRENLDNSLFDIHIVVINGIEIDLYSKIFSKIERNFDTDYLTDVFNEYWYDGITTFLNNPEVYIDKILENKTSFYIWIYNYMNSKTKIELDYLQQNLQNL